MPRAPYPNAAKLDQTVTNLLLKTDFSILDLTESLARIAAGHAADLLAKGTSMATVQAWNGLAKNLADAPRMFDADMKAARAAARTGR